MPSQEPPYLRIADDLRRRVSAGEWPVGERLPSRAKLAETYDVGANVLQRAQELLIAEGLLEGRTGSGTYVRTPTERRPMPRSWAGTAVEGACAPDSWESHTDTRVPAPEHIAHRLGIAPGDATVRTRYEYLADRRPVQLAESWEPMAVTDGTPVLMPEYGPLGTGRGVVARMASIGVRVARVVERPRPARATLEQANLLGISVGDLVTVIERTHLDADGRAVETADLVVPDARWDIVYELAVGPFAETAES
ncbi:MULTISPECIES: GntR family transcriptional regulator [Kitasatospora]|uniref:GntR family transcriptional regulator n=2 Tax=Kitasatospora TaxID=2063 RepID=A0ABT1IRF3_9ACTN|nr:GntR family transcriptional regulator [Kitasatospora paracochleata]MCP2307718.1 GntR family transcriptional regulator [Kitasatospora paracochleata]